MKKRFILLCLITFLFVLFIDSSYVLPNIINYSELFIRNLVPYLLFVFTISSMLIDYGLLEIVSPTLYVFILSLISGFPSSSKYSVSLYKDHYLDKDNAMCLIRNCHYPNPLFLFGSISNLISKYSCLKLFIVFIISSLIGMLFDRNISFKRVYIKSCDTSLIDSFGKSFKSSILTIIMIYGTSLFSYTIAEIIIRNIHLNSILYCIIYGLFDLTKGIFSTGILINKKIREILILLFISFGSISIHMQVADILRDTDIKYSTFLFGRIRNTFICIMVYSLLGKLY